MIKNFPNLRNNINLHIQFSSVTQSCPTLCDLMNRSTPGFPVCHQLSELAQTHVHRVGDAIQPSHPVVPFSSHPQSFPGPRSFPMSQLFASGGQNIGASASASVLPMTIQGCFPLGLTGLISLLSKRFSRVFFSTTIQKHQLFSAHLYLWSHSYIHTYELILSSFYSLRKIKIKGQIIH